MNMLMTTTDIIQGYKIEKYYGYISVCLVSSTSMLQDFVVGITDAFGGISDEYTMEISELKEMAIHRLEQKGRKVGANAIIGLKFNFNPIFGGTSKSMFMISVSGTGVKVKGLELKDSIEFNYNELIEQIELLSDINIGNDEFKDLTVISSEELDFLLDKDEDGIYLEIILNDLIEISRKDIISLQAPNLKMRKKLKLIKEYIWRFEKEKYIHLLFNDINKFTVQLIKILQVIDYKLLREKFENTTNIEEKKLLFYLLEVSPHSIEKSDVVEIKDLIEYLNTQYNDEVEIIKTSFGKNPRWKCKKCGKIVKLEEEECSGCNYTKRGIPGKFKFEKRTKYLKDIYTVIKNYYEHNN